MSLDNANIVRRCAVFDLKSVQCAKNGWVAYWLSDMEKRKSRRLQGHWRLLDRIGRYLNCKLAYIRGHELSPFTVYMVIMLVGFCIFSIFFKTDGFIFADKHICHLNCCAKHPPKLDTRKNHCITHTV